MFSASVKSDVLGLLRLDYQRKVQLLTEGLRQQFADAGAPGREAGELAVRASLLHQVETLCHRIFVRDTADAFLVLACSPSAALADEGGGMAEAEWVASRAVALDVLREARRNGWYRPARAAVPPPPEVAPRPTPEATPATTNARIGASF
jgi:hypothetical protein